MFHLGMSPLASASAVTWLPGDPHGCRSADVAGCRPGASLLRLLGMAAVLGRAWLARPLPTPRRVCWEDKAVEDAEPMLRDFCMLKRDGISANMASMESTL